MNAQQTSISSDDDNELKQQREKFVQKKTVVSSEHTKRAISTIVLDLKKLQQSGLDRKIAEALIRQKAAAATIATSSSSSYKNDNERRSNQRLNETMNDDPISNNVTTITTPSIEATTAATNYASSKAKVYLNASKNFRNTVPPTITITKAMDSPPERMGDLPSCSTSSLSANQTRLDLMSSKDRLEHAKKLLKRNILIKRANFNAESASAGNNQLTVPKAVIVRNIMKSREVTNTKPPPKILNFTNPMKTTPNMVIDNNREKEFQAQLRNPADWSTREAYYDFKRPFPKKTLTVQQIRQTATTTTTTSLPTSFSTIVEKQKHNTMDVDNKLPDSPGGSNLIVLENKILTPDEKIDLNDLRLNNTIKGKEENLATAQINLPLRTPTKFVAQPKKFIINADKLKRTPEELAALAKQIQSRISSNKGTTGGGIQKSLLKVKALKNVGKSMEIKNSEHKTPSQISLIKDDAIASKITSNKVMKSNDSPHHHNTLVGAHVTINNPSNDKQNSSPVASFKYKFQTESNFESFPVHDVNVQSQLLDDKQHRETTFTEDNQQTIENLNANFEKQNNNGNNKQIPKSINQEHNPESNHSVVTDTEEIFVACPLTTNMNIKQISSSVELEKRVDQNKTNEIETTTVETIVSKPILSAVDFIAALAATNHINETMEMELSPEELDLNATFSSKLSTTNHLTNSLTEEERQLLHISSSKIDNVSDISIGQIFPLNNVNILDATVDETADSNILHIVSPQKTEVQEANINTELVTIDQTTTNDNLDPEIQLQRSTENFVSNSNEWEGTSLKVDTIEKIPENVAPQRKSAGRFKKGKINLVQRSKPTAKKAASTEKVQSTEIGDLPQESTEQIRTEIEIWEPPSAESHKEEEFTQITEETLNIVAEQNTESNQIEKISCGHIESLDSSYINAPYKEEKISTLNESIIEEEQLIVEEFLEPTLHKNPEEVIIDIPNTSPLTAINYVEPDHGPPQVPFKDNTSTEQVNEMKGERPIGIYNLLKIIEDNTIQQGIAIAALEESKSDDTEVKSDSSKKGGGPSQPRKKLIKAKPVLKTKRQTKNKDGIQNSKKISTNEDREREDKDQVPLKDITTIDKDNENKDDAHYELNNLNNNDDSNPLEGKQLHHLTLKRKQSDLVEKDNELSTQSSAFIVSPTNQSNQSDPDREERVESSHIEAAEEEDCATGLEYNIPTVQFKRRRLETEQESEQEIENTTQFTKYSCDDETAKDESSQDEHCILADRKRLRKSYHNKTTKTVEPMSDSDDESFFGFDELEATWNPRRQSEIPSSSSSGMPLKKRWELLKDPRNETDVTDDTSPIEDEIIEEIHLQKDPHNETNVTDDTTPIEDDIFEKIQFKETMKSTSDQVMEIPGSSSSGMPLKKRWELLKDPRNETDVTDDTSPIEDEIIEEIQLQKDPHNEDDIFDKIPFKETNPSNNVEVIKTVETDPTFVDPIEASTPNTSKEESTNKNKEDNLNFKKFNSLEHSEENEIVMEISEDILPAVPQKKSLRVKNRRDLLQFVKSVESELQPAKRRRRGKSPETFNIMEHEEIAPEIGCIHDKSDDTNIVNQHTIEPEQSLESIMPPQPKKRGRKSKPKAQSSTTEINDDSTKDNISILEESQIVASPMPEPKKRGRKPKQPKTQSFASEINEDSIVDNMPLTEESEIAASPMPEPKRRGRKPKHTKAETETNASEESVDIIKGDISSIEVNSTSEENSTTSEPITFDPRLLLISKRDQLKSDEELRVPDGTGPLQCGLCLGRTTKSGWVGHVSKHYGIGWLVGETPLNVTSRSVILSTANNFFRKTGIKGLACRMCQRLYRSALGLLLHIEMCGETQQRLECGYCKKSYTKLSLPVHERQCVQRIALSISVNQGSDSESNTEDPNESTSNQSTQLFSNSGRAKRISTLKAESKLKDIKKALTAEADEDFADFDPKEYVKYESAYNVIKLQKKWEGQLKNFGSTFCPHRICTFSTTDLSEMLKHIDDCKHILKPGFYCTACKKDITNFESEALAIKHVIQNHKPIADFETDGSDYDDQDNSSNNDDDDFSSGVDSNEDEPTTENSDEENNEAVSGSRKLRINRIKSKATVNVTQQQLFPGRQKGLNRIMSHKWQKFVRENHTKNVLYDYALPMYKILDKIEAVKYLPIQETSMKFSYEHTENVQKDFGMKTEKKREWTQLGRFESMHQKNEHFTFIGGAIRHLAWIPLPGSASEQYLAISYCKPQQFTRHCNPKLTPSIILIMKFEESRNNDSGAWQLNSSIHYGIRIPEGPVHSFALLPSGGYNEETNRLGLIAVACATQNIKIYALPLKLSEDLETDSNSFIVLDLTPALELTLELQPQNIENKLCDDVQCMQICWSESQGHNLLVGGFSNGCIGFWDIEENETENLNRFMVEEKRYFVPLNYIYFGEKNIRFLALHYGEEGARWLAVAGSTRRYGIFNIRNLSAPQKISADVNTQVTSCIDWPPMWETISFGWCNILSKSGGRVISVNPIGVGYNHCTIDLMLNTSRSVHYSTELLIQAFGNDNGDIVVLNPRELHLESTILKSQSNQRALSMIDLQCLSDNETCVRQKELDKPTINNEDFKQRYGIIYKSLVKVPHPKRNIFLHENRRPPNNLLSYLRVNCVRFNRNASAQRWLATGCENGFLRIFNFKRDSYFHIS